MQKKSDKQIEELKNEISYIINDAMYFLLDEEDCNFLAEELYEKGYRRTKGGEE